MYINPHMNCVARSWCSAQTPSRNIIIYFWVGFIHTCMLRWDIVHLRIGKASSSTISRCSFKLLLLDSNIACVTLSNSSCLPPFLTELDLYWHCYNLCARDGIMWDPRVSSHGSYVTIALGRLAFTMAPLIESLTISCRLILQYAHS